MGVIVILANADPENLRPPQGDLMWHSPVSMNFKPFFLNEYARMMNEDGAEVSRTLTRTKY